MASLSKSGVEKPFHAEKNGLSNHKECISVVIVPNDLEIVEMEVVKMKALTWEILLDQDERDAIQKKTFTKWVNKHLKKAHRHVNDLFTDLQDGHNLISLLEVLSGEQLPREKGRMRFHMLQNVELVLNFLRYKKVCIDINT
nr:plectin-like [Halyomorpha halys]